MFLNTPKAKKGCVVLLSGGLDSAVTLAEASLLFEKVIALTFNYGQKAASKEFEASKALAEHYKAEHHVIDLPWFGELLPKAMDAKAGNNWTGPASTDEGFYEAEPVWVPNRNGVFLNIAAAFAEANEFQYIAFGANAEEGEAFPDNTREYRYKLEDALALSTLNKVEVFCPVGEWTKARMVQRALEIKLPLELVWSCYTAEEKQCGKCPSSVRFKNALEANEDSKALVQKLFA